MKVYHYGNEQSNIKLIQMVDDHDMEVLENEINLIKELSGVSDFHLIAVKVDNWNNDLSPWEAPAVFGNEGFGGNASQTLDYLVQNIVRPIEDSVSDELQIYIGGYSLSGLFALWSVYQTDIFDGCVAASPSVWFPDFTDYISDKTIKTKRVYLSLGNKEEKTKNPVMRQVGDAIRKCYSLLENKISVTLEWNEGNHFKEPDLRTAKGFAWLLTEKC